MTGQDKKPDDDNAVSVPRSFADGAEGGYQTDTFSRNDGEGATALGGEAKPDPERVRRELDAGAEGDYQTDTFSRNDAEGGTALGEDAAEVSPPPLGEGDRGAVEGALPQSRR